MIKPHEKVDRLASNFKKPSVSSIFQPLPSFCGSRTDEDLVRMAKEAWFMERVFDVFLWEVGVGQQYDLQQTSLSARYGLHRTMPEIYILCGRRSCALRFFQVLVKSSCDY
jgi:hypothetical protein